MFLLRGGKTVAAVFNNILNNMEWGAIGVLLHIPSDKQLSRGLSILHLPEALPREELLQIGDEQSTTKIGLGIRIRRSVTRKATEDGH